MKKNHIATLLLCLSCIAIIMPGCDKKKPAPTAPPPPKVEVTKVGQKDIPVYVRSIGNVVPFATVKVMPQVSGEVTGAYFTEGTAVSAGDLLFSIDSRTYEAALQQQQAILQENMAILVYNEERVARYKGLVTGDIISQLDYENYTSSMKSYQALVLQSQAAIEQASINLGYCQITSPITGYTGKRLVDPGNYIAAASNEAMVVINQTQPIYVDFSIPEKYFTDLVKYRAKGDLTVMARVPGIKTGAISVTATGKLVLVDNAIDMTTGTVPLRAQFDNEDNSLWPGQFVEVFIEMTKLEGAAMVPSEAVKLDTKGSWVYVVKSDLTLEQQRVTPGQIFGTNIAIQKGLKPGQTIVTKGHISVRPGMKVTPITPTKTDSEESSSDSSGE